MKKGTSNIISTCLILFVAFIANAQAPTGSGIGELRNQYTCKIEGYTIKVYRPAHVPGNSNVRQIHVDTHAKSFYARWPELNVLLQSPNLVIYQENLGFQMPPYNICDRNGYKIVDQNAYYVQTQNQKNYTGYTVDLDGINLDTAGRTWLVTVFNQNKVQHHIDVIPTGCKDGCLDLDGIIPDDPGDTPSPGGHTLADGTVEAWNFEDWLFGGTGPTITVGGVVEILNQDFNQSGGGFGCINGVMVDLYTPIIRSNRFSLGVKASGAYRDGGGLYCWGKGSVAAIDIVIPIPVDGVQSEVMFHEGDRYSQTQLIGAIGLQANLSLAKRLVASASAQLGYLSSTQQPFSILQEVDKRHDIRVSLVEQERETHSTLFFSPGVRLNFLLSRTMSLFAGVDYTFGGETTYQRSELLPAGGPNEGGAYFIDQLLSGRISAQEVKSKNQFLDFKVGLSFGLSRR